jgi:hypothetical protein
MSDEREQAKPDAESQPAAAERTADGACEVGGPKGPEPTRYGDWERAGRCIDF